LSQNNQFDSLKPKEFAIEPVEGSGNLTLPSKEQPTLASANNGFYDATYYQNYCGEISYGRTEHWFNFFGGIADRIIYNLQPKTVLDAGCAIGLLVESLRNRGVEAYGADISDYAIQQVRDDLKPFCWTANLLDPLPQRYDLITCIEVIEHLQPQESEKLVENLCRYSDDILLSSTPLDYEEGTHFNVQDPEYWARLFAKYGFWHEVEFDASFIAPWAMLFRKLQEPVYTLAAPFERKIWRLNREVGSLRQSLLTLRHHNNLNNSEIQQLQVQKQQLQVQKQNEIDELQDALAHVTKDRDRLERDLHISTKNSQRLLAEADANLQERQKYIQKLENERLQLLESKAAIEQELYALMQTRTVRTSRSLGQLAQQLQRSANLTSNVFAGRLLRTVKGAIEGALDYPATQVMLPGSLEIRGWAVSSAGPIQQVEVWLGQEQLGLATYGLPRTDVIALRPWQSLIGCGYTASFTFDPAKIGLGPQTLLVRVSDKQGHQHDYSCPVVVVEPPPAAPVPTEHPTPQPEEKELYLSWIANNEPDAVELLQQSKLAARLDYRPLISILTPVYNTPPAVLQATLESVVKQTYAEWELCLVDGASADPQVYQLLAKFSRSDQRIKVQTLTKNRGISGNSQVALEMAQGEFIALLDHDDTLSPNALYEMALLLNRHREADMVYSDEDKIDEQDQRSNPFFKPDWSPDLFRSMMYTCHLGLYRTSLVRQIGGFRDGFDGAQDYDLVLRVIEKTNQIYHIPKVLYHWRTLANSTARSTQAKEYARQAQLKAMTEHCQRTGLKAEIEFGLTSNTLRVRRLLEQRPKVSIIIPTRDQAECLKLCIDSIQSRTDYPTYEILIVDNNSVEKETLAYFETVSQAHDNIRVVSYPHEFNFSAINNFAVTQATGDLLLFLNNDTEVISGGWLNAMVEHALRPEVGAVGACLLYPDQRLQHAGIILGVGGVAGHSHKYLPADQPGYFSRTKAIQNFSAVTGACLLTRRDVFQAAGGFDEHNLAIAFNDVDYCLRLREKGLLVVWTPYAELYHHESLSRGAEDAPHKVSRFQREIRYMHQRWSHVIPNDPYYNPNLTLHHEDFSLDLISRYLPQ
jgi:GT2 family glycosyltransferase/2-polyprenyl-3-methyl-5-hydroxy-6-metoxy-1,4-benzoquinol methylase